MSGHMWLQQNACVTFILLISAIISIPSTLHKTYGICKQMEEVHWMYTPIVQSCICLIIKTSFFSGLTDQKCKMAATKYWG